MWEEISSLFGCIQNTLILTLWSLAESRQPINPLCNLWLYSDDQNTPLYDLWLYQDDPHNHSKIFGCTQETTILIWRTLAVHWCLPYSLAVSRQPPYSLSDFWLYPDDFHTHSMIFGCIQTTPYSLLGFWLYPEDSHTHIIIFGCIHTNAILTLYFFLYPDHSNSHTMIFGCNQRIAILTLWFLLYPDDPHTHSISV